MGRVSEIRLGACNTPTETSILPFTGRIDEVYAWSTELAEVGSLSYSAQDTQLLGHWSFNDAPAYFPFVWRDRAGHGNAVELYTEIRVISFEGNAATYFLDAAGTSMFDTVEVNRDEATPVELHALTSLNCIKAKFRITELPDLGILYETVDKVPRQLNRGQQITEQFNDIGGSSVIFEIPEDIIVTTPDTSFVYAAMCVEGNGNVVESDGELQSIVVTLKIRQTRPYPILALGNRLQHHVKMVQLVDPDEDEYNAASTFSLTINGGQSPSASVETTLTMAASISRVTSEDGSVSALVVEGTGTSSEVNAILSSTFVESNAQNPLDVHYRVGVVGVNAQDDTLEYHFSHTLVKSPSITEIRPAEVSTAGSLVEVRGRNFIPGTMCLFNDLIVVESIFVSRAVVYCDIPKTNSTGIFALSVTISNNSAHERSNIKMISVVPQFRLWDVTPASGIAYPGSEITVRGSPSFQGGSTMCRFVDNTNGVHTIIEPHDVSAGSLICRLPQVSIAAANQSFSLEISQNRFDFYHVETFQVYERPVLARLTPSTGAVEAQSHVITVYGLSFFNSSKIQCRINGILSPGDYISPASVQCILRAGVHYNAAKHLVLIDLSFNGGDEFTGAPITFRLTQPITLTCVKPDNAPTCGQTAIAIYGVGFVKDELYWIKFLDGNTEVTSRLHFINDSALEWTTPAVNNTGIGVLHLGAGSSEMKLEDINEDSSIPVLFTFTQRPTVHSVVPSMICAGVDSTVSVLGTYFDNFETLTCTLYSAFGNEYFFTRAPEYIDQTIVQCIIPGTVPEGIYFVSISNNGIDGSLSNKNAIVQVYKDVKLAGLSVTSGPVTGGSEVEVIIEGGMLRPADMACSFGLVRVRAQYISSTEARCTSPPWDERMSLGNQSVPVRLTLNGLDFSGSSLLFRYHALPVFESLFPAVVPVNAMITVSIGGRYFAALSGDVLCRIGHIKIVSARVMPSGRGVICGSTTSSFAANQLVDVEVSLNGGHDFIVSPIQLAIRERVQLSNLNVSHVLFGSTGSIIVIGSGFYRNRDDDVVCSYDYYLQVRGEFINTEQIRCPIPPDVLPSSGYKIRVSLNGGTHFSTGWSPALDIYELPTFDTVAPGAGFAVGKNMVHVTGSSFFANEAALRIECIFGDVGVPVLATVLSPIDLTCSIPYGHYIGQPHEVQLQFKVESVVINSSLAFTFLPTISVNRVAPSSLPVEQPLVVFIWGSRFVHNRNYSIQVGDSVVQRARIADESMLVFPITIPRHQAASVSNRMELLISVDDTGFAGSGFFVDITPNEPKQLVQPYASLTAAPVNMATNVTICASAIPRDITATEYVCESRLENLKTNISSRQQATTVIGGCVRCPLLPPQNPSNATVVVVHEKSEVEIANITLEWYEPPEIDQIWPDRVFTPGSLQHDILVFGKGFRSDLAFTCYFNHVAASSSQVINDSAARCGLILNSMFTSEVTLQISNNGVDLSTSFRYLQIIRDSINLLSVYPQFVASNEQTTLSLRGNNFVIGSTYCFFKSLNLSVLAEVQSSTHASCVFTRLHDNIRTTSVRMNVGLSNETSTNATQIISVLERPEIRRISPSSGKLEGNTSVSIVGTGFPSYLVPLFCHFGQLRPVRAKQLARDLIICLSPPSRRGFDAPLRLSIGQQIFSSSSVNFTYHDAPVITSIAPTYGVVTGGSKVMLTGRNLDMMSRIMCFFGVENPAQDVRVISSTRLMITSPSSNSGAEELAILTCLANDDPIESSRLLAFQYVVPPHVNFVDPPVGFAAESTTIHIYGREFPVAYPVFCQIGANDPSVAVFVSESVMRCVAHPHVIGFANVRVTLDAGVSTTDNSDIVFEYIGKYSLSGVSLAGRNNSHLYLSRKPAFG